MKLLIYGEVEHTMRIDKWHPDICDLNRAVGLEKTF